ncbi:unnamed protein product [Paramecium pentaurelia]|uniref:J domain-containing protein n=1 Tax=Paramecium pentaurelia TaxID=43138 RepID=A0A8S1XZL5_9CILI|nr:unnamed protein product [Paramecium pentaurelia]
MFITRFRNLYKFSSVIDPYQVLGVDKFTSFPEIKKAYYKMAAQYHPDINKTPSAQKQFILIKESFEKIKVMKGEAVQMNSEGSIKKENEYESVRKNYKDYDENFSESNEQKDYKEFYHQAEDLKGQEYDHLKKSFQTIHEVKDIKFKPIDMKMPDPSKRFNLGQVMHLKIFSDGSNLYIITICVGMFILFFVINSVFQMQTKRKTNSQLYNLLNKQVIKEDLEEEQLLQQVTTQIEKTQEFKQFKQEQLQKQEKSTQRRRQIVPEIQTFVSATDLKDSVL